MINNNKKHKFSYSLVALAILGVSSAVSAAEDTSATNASNTENQASEASVAKNSEKDVEVIEVTGLRRSLYDATDIKRSADTFVDAISASDIGSLPDKSVLESMQRIPGVSIERFAAADDPDHFGVEGSGAVIRGMSQTRSEFNGRDSFSANSGNGLNFQDVPPELMGSIRVYKNQSADMIEGGIGGTVDLHTRLPFDQDGRVISIGGDFTYNDLSETTEPSLSALYSDIWDTDKGKFGFLFSIANNQVTSESHSLQQEVVIERNKDHAQPLVEGQTVYAPNGGNMARKLDERERLGMTLAAQWESSDKRTLVTGQFLRSDADLAWTENTVSYQTEMNDGDTLRDDSFPLDGYPEYEFDSSGTFQSGFITNQRADGWRSNAGDGARMPNGALVPQFGHNHQASTRLKQQNTVISDTSINVKFRPDDNWSHEFDAQYINASTKDDDVTLYLGFDANQYLDVSGDQPVIGYLEPWNNHPAGNGREGNEAYFQDPSSYYWRSAMDHYERSKGDEFAVTYDVKYVIDSGFFSSIKAGVRYAKRQQDVRTTTYNWQTLGAPWSTDIDGDGHNAAWLDLDATAYLLGDTEAVAWGDLFRGGQVYVPGGTTIHPSAALVKDYANWGERLAPIAADWEPLADRQIQNGIDANGNPTYEQLDSHFRPAEINSFEDENTAIYVRVDFESELAGFPYSGNFGVRYVENERSTKGAVTFPNLIPTDPTDELDSLNHIPADDVAFGNYGTRELNDVYTDEHFLPSFNLKVDLHDDVIFRFAASKAIAYPDTGDMKNYVSIGNENAFVVRSEVPGEDKILSADILGWTGNSGNAYLEPMESVQFDAGVEWYFSDSGSITTVVFYKDLSNFFVTGNVVEPWENNGVTNNVDLKKPINSGDGTMQGFELAYHQFFDFLPAPFDGLGMEATYSYVDAQGVPNSNLFKTSTGGVPEEGKGSADLEFDALPLQGQSEHTANFVLMYEKGDISSRLAYNWRSEYLITVRDVIAPYRPVYSEPSGYLDGSIFYNVTEEVKIGLQAVNLLDTQTETTMQIDEAGRREGRSWFINDRRFSFVVRATF